jgi:putative heme-binding domain-containing protein
MTNAEGNPNGEALNLGFGHSFVIRHSSFVILLCALIVSAVAQSDDGTSLAVEALTRLQNVDLEKNARLKETVSKLLERTRGTPNYLKLIKHFKMQGDSASLLDLAAALPSDEAGVEAMRMALAAPDRRLIEGRLSSPDEKSAASLAQALGNSGSKEAVPLLRTVVQNEKRGLTLRKEAVRALARTEHGAAALLQLAKDDRLAEELKSVAGLELSKVRWENIRADGAKVLPLPAGQNNEPLPALAELVKRKGNSQNGQRIFNSTTAACASCHKVKGQGTDVGPDLSEIGSKLAKEALYEAILDPSAGISFGYEAWQLELKNGDEPYGLIVSETPDEVAVKSNTGVVTRYKKAEVKSRQQMKLSIMPSGLQQAMSPQELIDMVEYLVGLKKPGT